MLIKIPLTKKRYDKIQGSSKLKIQINEPRFKKGEVFFIAFRLL